MAVHAAAACRHLPCAAFCSPAVTSDASNHHCLSLQALIAYFSAIPGVHEIRPRHNPANWCARVRGAPLLVWCNLAAPFCRSLGATHRHPSCLTAHPTYMLFPPSNPRPAVRQDAGADVPRL